MSTYPEICHLPACPCREFALKTPQDAPERTEIPREPKTTETAPIPVYRSGIALPDFSTEWNSAPRWTTRTTERESAEWWFIRGQHAKEVELVALLNLDLAEMVRVARERVSG